ncbi:MAG TPA: cysteine desulfurase [Patescibacteria group bacterium]|nr:cysteine desulfurase [Patescibacteria group bacterium]
MKKIPADILKDFPSLHAMGMRAYLDSAASSLTPVAVTEAMDDYYANYRANVHRGMYATSAKATERYEAVRGVVAGFLNASADEIVFTSGTTDALNLLASSLGRTYGPGDEVVLTEMEHHANLVPWQEAAKRHGFALKFIPLTPEYALDMDAARAIVTPKTKAVSVVHASNVLGTVNPAKEIAALAHAVGAVVILDAAQSVAHMKIDVRDLDCDFFAFSAHKTYGPTGVGVLYGKKKLLENLEPARYGGDMIREVKLESSTWNESPWKFEAGTPNVAGVIGLGAALRYLADIGMDAVRAHDRALTTYALEKISAIPGVRIVGPAAGERIGAISFEVEGAHPHDLATLLDREGVAVRGGHHCAMPLMSKLGLAGTCRASFGLYTEEKDVDALVDALLKAKAVLKI